jgi:anti-sigma B factor antagonist
MDLHVEPAGDVAVVEVLAETVDLSNATELKARLADLTAAHRFAVVDLGRVRYLDSSGCGALVGAMTHFRSAGGDLRLCGATPQVKTLLELVRLTRVLTLHATCEEAIAAFSGK